MGGQVAVACGVARHDDEAIVKFPVEELLPVELEGRLELGVVDHAGGQPVRGLCTVRYILVVIVLPSLSLQWPLPNQPQLKMPIQWQSPSQLESTERQCEQ